MYKGWALLTGDDAKVEHEKIRARREAADKNRTAAGRVMTNASFAATDEEFKKACEKAGIPPSARQASKWFRKAGLAYQKGR
jgi:transposase